MERMMSATEARVHFGKLMRWVVESQEPVIVEHGGKPHVVVLSMARYKLLRMRAQGQANWKDLVQQAREQIRSELGDRELTPPEEIIRQMREERDAQLLAALR